MKDIFRIKIEKLKLMENKYIISGGLIALSALSAYSEQKQDTPLNIVYIMADDHTTQMLSCYDNRYVETPN